MTYYQTKFKETEIGSIPEEWGVDNVGNISLIITDYVANGSFASLKEYVKYSDIKDYAILIRLVDFNINFFDNFVYVNKEGYDFLKKTKLFGGEIIISNVGEYAGTVFRVPFIKNPMTLGPNSIMVKTKYNDNFYYYWFKSIYGIDSLQNVRSGSAVPKFNKTDFKKIIVPIPPDAEQKQIVEILSSLDDKIKLNCKINTNLEKLASSLFKQWFIDIGEKLPKGWRIVELGSFVEILNGFAFKSVDYTNGGVFLLRTSNFEDNGYANNNDTIFLPSDFIKSYNNYLLKKFDVLLVMVGASVGKLSFVTSRILPALQNQNMWNFRAKDSNNQLFVKFLVQNIVKENIGSASGSARDFFRKDYFKKIKFIQPEQKIIDNFISAISPFYDEIDKNILEIDTLSAVRNSLLPRLMSGKIRVK